jgi:hypothetical protein
MAHEAVPETPRTDGCTKFAVACPEFVTDITTVIWPPIKTGAGYTLIPQDKLAKVCINTVLLVHIPVETVIPLFASVPCALSVNVSTPCATAE